MSHRIPPVLSTLFRAAAYLFLQIIPTRLAQPVLPTLYFLYLFTAYFCPPPEQPAADEKKQPLPPPDALSTIVLSLQTHSPRLRYANIIINTLLFAAALDLTLTPFIDTAHAVTYTRVGAVYPDGVKIQVRYPTNESLLVFYREQSETEWKQGPVVNTEQESDWVQTVRLSGLWPSTKYEYSLANLNKTLLPISTKPVSFRTFPDPRLNTGSRFRFIASSCLTPNFPYRGPLHRNSIRGFDLLADYLEKPDDNTTAVFGRPPTDFLLFLGDFIYADVPVYVGDDKAAYQRLYRPIIHAYDDHEIINNYIGNSQEIPPFANATAAYNIYAAHANYDPAQAGQSFYNFQHGDVAYFVLDTRRHRSHLDGTDPADRTMLGEDQLTALYNWLGAVNSTSTFKFVVSSVPFTELWTYEAQYDSWAAYPAEKAALLDAFHSVPNLIILSGDRHEFAAIEFNPPNPGVGHVVREFSTSPLSMFYIPFIRTLLPQSSRTFTKNVTLAENVTEQVEIPYERTISYIPVGNYKWSTFELDTRNSRKPILRVETVVDGKPAYHVEIIGAPARPAITSLGSLVSTNFKDLFDKIGIKPARWF